MISTDNDESGKNLKTNNYSPKVSHHLPLIICSRSCRALLNTLIINPTNSLSVTFFLRMTSLKFVIFSKFPSCSFDASQYYCNNFMSI